MGMGMGTRIYALPGGDGNGIKVGYPLGFGMRMNIFFGDGYGIAKSVYTHLVAIPTHGK